MKSIISGAIVATVVALLAINVNAKSIGHFSYARLTSISDTGKMAKMSKMSKMSKKDTGKMSKMSKMDKKKSKMAKKDTTSKM